MNQDLLQSLTLANKFTTIWARDLKLNLKYVPDNEGVSWQVLESNITCAFGVWVSFQKLSENTFQRFIHYTMDDRTLEQTINHAEKSLKSWEYLNGLLKLIDIHLPENTLYTISPWAPATFLDKLLEILQHKKLIEGDPLPPHIFHKGLRCLVKYKANPTITCMVEITRFVNGPLRYHLSFDLPTPINHNLLPKVLKDLETFSRGIETACTQLVNGVLWV